MQPLVVKDLKKSYSVGWFGKKRPVLKGVNFSVEKGKITGFLGANGAGKTTTLRCLLGLAYADSGSISFFGNSKLSLSVKKRIGFLPERPYFYEHLTGVEFLRFYSKLSGDTASQKKIDELIERVDLTHSKDQQLGEYSKGMLQKIGIAQALIHDPEFLIFDEPMSGLDPDGRYYLSEIIRQCGNEGRTVFFSSHLLPDAEKLCQNLVILKDGSVVYQGGVESFMDQVGDSSLITYVKNDEKLTLKVDSNEGLQKSLRQLLDENARIVDVKKDRNLEEAFIKIGLRGQP